MTNTNKRDLGKDPVGRLLFSLAIPAIAAQLVNMLYNIVDRMYIGRMDGVGANALTGVGLVFPILMMISAFSALVASGGAPKAAIKMGEGNLKGAEKIMGNCFIMLLLISAVIGISFYAFAEPILTLFGASSQTLPFALEYMKIYLLGTPFVCIALGMNAFITTQGFAGTGMCTVIIGAVINIILDPILIFGLFGVPKMGVKGAAIATVASQMVSAVWVVMFLFGKNTKLKIRKENFPLEKNVIAPVMALGLSPFIMQSTESLLSICFISSLSKYGGDLAVGALTIINSVIQMFQMPIMGLSQGAQPIISYNYGARNKERVKKTFKLLFIATSTFTVLFWLLIVGMPEIFAKIFTEDPILIEKAAWALKIYMAVGFTMAGQMSCQQTFVALGQAKVSLFLAMLRKIILLIPFIYIFPFFFADKVFAVFLAEPVADFIAAATTMTIFFVQFPKILNFEEESHK
ncbi:MAG: MATE family efflux transporter [Oscillospiraceae bacterium]